MNGSNWLVRAGIVSALTWVAVRYLPAGAPRTAALAIGAVYVSGIVAQNVPLVSNALAGNLLASSNA